MSNWTHITGVITVEPMGRCQAEARYILDMVLAHLPRVPGSEGDMEIYTEQKRGYNAACSCDEFGQWSNLGDVGDYGMFEMQTKYLLTLDAHLRDTVFKDTFRNFQKWLCRLAKRVSVLDLLIKITDDLDVAKTTIIQDAQPYEEMFEYPLDSIGNKDGEPAWYEFLYWERMKDCSYPMLLGYKYLNDPKNDNEIKRRNDWRKS